MQIDVGNEYINGNGEIVRIVRFDENDPSLPYVDTEGNWYRPGGEAFSMGATNLTGIYTGVAKDTVTLGKVFQRLDELEKTVASLAYRLNNV